MRYNQKLILPILWFTAIIVTAVMGSWSCSGTPAGAQIFLNINNDTGCNVVATLDGTNPVTNTASGGPYTLYTNVANGEHSVAIKGPLATSAACNYDVTGGNQTITVTNPCSAVNGTSGFILSCN